MRRCARRFLSTGPLPTYRALLASGALHADAAQLRAAAALQRLYGDLLAPASAAAGAGGSAPLPSGVYLHGGVGRGKTRLMDLFHASLPPGLSVRAHSHAYFLGLHAALHARRQGGASAVAAAATEALAGARVLCLDEVEISDIADAVLLRRVYAALRASGAALVATSNAAPERLYHRGLNRALLFLPFERELRGSADIVCLD